MDELSCFSFDGRLEFSGLKPNTSYVLVTKDRHSYLVENQHTITSEKAKLPEPTNHHPINNLRRGIETFAARSKVYGSNYRRVGLMMMSLYPDGLKLDCVEQWNRFGILFMILVKVSRYVIKPYEGHIDSAHDMSVYSAILEELTAEQQGLDVSAATLDKERDAGACEHVWQYPCHKEHKARQCNSKGLGGFMGHSCGKPTCTACGERREQ